MKINVLDKRFLVGAVPHGDVFRHPLHDKVYMRIRAANGNHTAVDLEAGCTVHFDLEEMVEVVNAELTVR